MLELADSLLDATQTADRDRALKQQGPKDFEPYETLTVTLTDYITVDRFRRFRGSPRCEPGRG